MFGEPRAHATGLGRHSRLDEPVCAISRCWLREDSKTSHQRH